AAASGRVADPKLVPVLAGLIDPNNLQVRWTALDALQKINTPEAARAAWPHLAEEADLARKLRLAEFVGRHGYRGGYPYAIEHLADPHLRDWRSRRWRRSGSPRRSRSCAPSGSGATTWRGAPPRSGRWGASARRTS